MPPKYIFDKSAGFSSDWNVFGAVEAPIELDLVAETSADSVR